MTHFAPLGSKLAAGALNKVNIRKPLSKIVINLDCMITGVVRDGIAEIWRVC